MNNENNNDLNAISLGNVDNSSNLNDKPIERVKPPFEESVAPVPFEPTESIMPVSPEESVMPVNPVEPIKTPETSAVTNEPVQSASVEVAPDFNDMFNSIPNNNIGTVPPLNNNDSLNIPVAPVAPVEPVTPVEPEGSENNLDPVAPVEPLPFDIPSTINNYDSVPVFNEIGTIPPIPDTPAAVQNQNKPNKKKSGNKVLFVLIVLVAMAAVGVGVYMFLHISNTKAAPVKVKNVEIEMGSTVSSLITDYATFIGIDYKTCSLDTTDIKDTNTLNAEYPFAITCNDTVYKGTAKIVDKTKPEVTLKKVNAELNSEIKAEAFIDTCKDNSQCSYEFKDEVKLKDNLAQAGTYEVPIIVKDESGNEIEVIGTLVVNTNVADLYLICSKGNDNFMETNKLGLVNNEFNRANTRSYTFKLNSDEYQKLKTESEGKTEVTYNNITGLADFRDEDTSLVLSKYLTYDDLTKEQSEELPLQIGALKEFYQTKGYDCNLGY